MTDDADSAPVVITQEEDINADRLGVEVHGVGVLPRDNQRAYYDLTVVGLNLLDTITSAGGWMYDRVRAGWRINAVILETADPRPLQILGVTTRCESELVEQLDSGPAALAIPSRVLGRNSTVRDVVLRALHRNTEVSFWGEELPVGCRRRLDHVEHRLTAAAKAFKAHALCALSADVSVAPTEAFRSCGLWYPPGPDLMPPVIALT